MKPNALKPNALKPDAMNLNIIKPGCAPFQDDLLAYHHRELPPLRRALVLRHLSQCSRCRKELQIMEQITATLAEAETATQAKEAKEGKRESVTSQSPAFDAGLREKILSSLPETTKSPVPQPSAGSSLVFKNRSPWLAWGALAATACVAAAIFFPTLSRSREDARSLSPPPAPTSILAPSPNVPSPAPAAGPAPETQNQLQDEEKRRSLDDANYAFSDGHAKSVMQQQDALQKRLPKAADRIAGVYGRNGAGSDYAAKEFAAGDKVARQNAIRGAAGAAGAPLTGSSTNGSSAANLPLTPYRRVHKEGSLTVEVEKLEAGSDAVESQIKKADGFIANSTLSTQADGLKVAALEIRVPVKQFETVIKQIGALGEVKSKRIEGEDITAQVSD